MYDNIGAFLMVTFVFSSLTGLVICRQLTKIHRSGLRVLVAGLITSLSSAMAIGFVEIIVKPKVPTQLAIAAILLAFISGLIGAGTYMFSRSSSELT